MRTLPASASLERHPERGDTARCVYNYGHGGYQKLGWTAAGRAQEQVDAMNQQIAEHLARWGSLSR